MSNYETDRTEHENNEPELSSNNGPVNLNDDGEIQSTWDEVHETFDDMNLNTKLVRGIYGYGFEKPSSIQQRAIVPCIKGMDVIAQAQSGTGKTATFAISILQGIDTSIKAGPKANSGQEPENNSRHVPGFWASPPPGPSRPSSWPPPESWPTRSSRSSPPSATTWTSSATPVSVVPTSGRRSAC